MAGVTLHNVSKTYGDVAISKDINLEIHNGEFVVFVGPSGCGKSTLLRMIAGLEDITAGDLMIGEKRMNDVPPAERGVGMVFQSYALYPHLSVADNMSFGLKLAGADKPQIQQRVNHASEVLQLAHLLDRKPKALSGGQRQRVAIGRTLVAEPQVFLLDEPLSNLDAGLRVQMRIEIARLHKRLRSTMIYVTHDQVEAMTLADKIVVLRAGKIEQVGKPLDLYNDPDNRFVAGFIGSPAMNFIEGRLEAGAVTVAGGEAGVVDEGTGPVVGTPIMGWLRDVDGPVDEFSQTLVLQAPEGVTEADVEAVLQAVLDRHATLRLRVADDGAGGWSLMVPEVGSSSVAIARIVVVFPAPLFPTKPKVSPLEIVSSCILSTFAVP